MSRREDYADAYFLCFFGTTHVKSISKILATFLLLLCIMLTGFGFCSTSNEIVIFAGTFGCLSTLLLLLVLVAVVFSKPQLLLPFLVTFGIYMVSIISVFILYILLGTSTDLINTFFEKSDWLNSTYNDLQLDIKSNQVRMITCVIVLVIGIIHTIFVVFVFSVFLMTYLYMIRIRQRARNISGTTFSAANDIEHSPTTPLNTRLFNHTLFYADSSPSINFSQQTHE